MDWLWFLGVVAVVAWLVAVVDLIRRRRELSGGQFAAWILIVIILPVLGTIHHPAWDKFFGSPADPSTALVFGEKGSGKKDKER